ncbi:MAG: CAP domain-containing protein [Bacteroidota bacterium]
MHYLMRQIFVKPVILFLIPLLAAILLTSSTSNVLAKNLSNEQTNLPHWRNVQTSPAEDPKRSTSRKPSGVIDLTPEEARIFKLINQERAEAGLAQLEIDPTLTQLARDKSLDMVSHNYFGHYSERFGTIHDQLEVNAVSYCNAAENLAGGSNIIKTHRRLLASPAHRSNILNPKFKRVGIGIVKGSPYGKMMTQVFID